MLLLFLAIALLLPTLNISAQTVLSNSGAKNEALASLTATSTDEWSLWRNPAGLSSIDQSAISFGVRRAPGINTLTRSIVVAHNMQAGTVAAGVSAFGDDVYNEQAISLGYANHIGLAAVGIRADVIQLRIDGNPTMRTVGITIGAIANLTPRLSVGLCARNVNLPEWARGQPLPVILNSGISFRPSESFLVAAEVEKNTDFDPTLKGAVEYSLRRRLVFMRTGFNLFPNAAFGGIGLRTWRLGFDYALRFGYLPGYSHQLSVALRVNKRKQE
jgi:hypothetical protein